MPLRVSRCNRLLLATPPLVIRLRKVLSSLVYRVLAMKKRFWVGVGLACAALGSIEYLNFTGFCYTQGRYLSEMELLDVGMQFAVHRQDKNTADRNVMYGSLREFRERNPKCCTISRQTSASATPILDRILGYYVCDVEVYYLATDATPVNNFYRLILSMNACGKIVDIRGIVEHDGPGS
jgi:hypothetical protein